MYVLTNQLSMEKMHKDFRGEVSHVARCIANILTS